MLKYTFIAASILPEPPDLTSK